MATKKTTTSTSARTKKAPASARAGKTGAVKRETAPRKSVQKKAASAAVKRSAASKARKSTGRVRFELNAPQAAAVALLGDFNSWDPGAVNLKKDKAGLWKTTLALKPGRYEYKYLVDGQWWTDPANTHRASNSFGSENSVLEIQ